MHLARINGRIGRVGGRILRLAPARPVYDFEAGTYAPFRSFVRASKAWAWSGGALVEYAVDQPRVVPTVGLLLEGAATNLVSRSNDQSANPPWISYGQTAPTRSRTTAPDGTETATRLGLAAFPNDFGPGLYNVAGLTTRVEATVSVWLRNPSPHAGIILGVDISGYGTYIEPTSNWTRYVYTRINSSGQAMWIASFLNRTLPRTIDIWGAQYEIGPTASSLIVTTDAASTRAAEAASLTVPAGCTTWTAVYGAARTEIGGSGLTPGAAFDLVQGRPWIGEGKELKRVVFQ